MKYSMPMLALIALAAVVQLPHTASGQNKDILSVQRDVVAVENLVKRQHAEQLEKIAHLEATNQNLAKALADLNAKLDKMQQDMARAMTEQQQRVAEPVGVLRSSVDRLAESVAGLQAAQANTGQRLGGIETEVASVKELVKAIGAPKVDEAPPPVQESPLAIQSRLFESAQRDFIGGLDELADQQFRELVEKYPDSPDAPQAYLYLGQIFDRAKQYLEAVTAYERVMNLYPNSAQVSEAMYSKGESLRLGGKKNEAIAAFRAFLSKYPSDPKKGTAEQRLRDLGVRP